MREPIPCRIFVHMIVRKGHKFLLIQEQKLDNVWYWPAGKVERGEDLFEAAKRETLEEAGIPIEIDGVLRIEQSVNAENELRLRIIFVGRPIDDTPPKSEPDEDSLQAGWFTIEEAAKLPLRGRDMIAKFRHILDGGFIAPKGVLTMEDPP